MTDNGYVGGRTQDKDVKFLTLESLISNGMASEPQNPEKIIEALVLAHELVWGSITDQARQDIEEEAWDDYHRLSGNLSRVKVNLSEEVRFFVLETSGSFSLVDVYRELNIKEPNAKASARMVLSRLVKDGALERVGSKDGVYRRIDTEIKRTKFITGQLDEFPVVLPAGINDLCKLYAKNIVVVAGSKSSGKTAFLMNIALDNQDNMPVVYLNSEMGDEEYTSRMKNFGIEREDQIKFETIECHQNFADHIDGSKKIFIIDYLEVHDNFYEVAKPIRAIHEKLGDGIAIIAVQKKQGDKLGRGGEFSMEKARLYLSLDYQDVGRCTRMTVVDAKSPKKQGGRGAYNDIKIFSGSALEPANAVTGTWQFPNE